MKKKALALTISTFLCMIIAIFLHSKSVAHYFTVMLNDIDAYDNDDVWF